MKRKGIFKFIDLTLILYVIIGVMNFIICTGLMFVLYNVADISQHIAPVVNYSLGSILWYVGCRFVLFRKNKTTLQQLLRFFIEVVVCYALAYYVIAPFVSWIILRFDGVREVFSFGGVDNISGNCDMAIGAASYALLNYFGQRYYVFSRRFESGAADDEALCEK